MVMTSHVVKGLTHIAFKHVHTRHCGLSFRQVQTRDLVIYVSIYLFIFW